MTALDTNRLHRHALHGDLLDALRPMPRPVLTATWQLEADGSLTCRWHASEDTGDPGASRLPR